LTLPQSIFSKRYDADGHPDPTFASGGDGSAEAAFIDGKNSPQKVVVFVASSPVPQDLAKSRTIPIIPVSLRDNAYTHE
jgi:hypothetical protein